MGLFRSDRELTGFSLLLLHGLCFALVVFYVNMFQFWAWLSRVLGPGPLVRVLPILVTMALLAVILSCFGRRVNREQGVDLVFFGLGIVCAFFALAIPDPHVPIKRIHVAEYILLAFLVRYTLSHRLQGRQLTLFTFLVTLLLGVHDEMLQGFHPLRYYGCRDIIVNGTAGLSGALLGQGLACCVRPLRSASSLAAEPDRVVLAGLYVALLGATGWLVYALYGRRDAISLWTGLPPAIVGILIAVIAPGILFNSRRQHGLQVVFWLAVLLPLYPLLATLTSLEFR